MTRRMWIATVSLIGLFVATYLWLYKIGVIGQLTCAVGSCEVVNTSKWATLLGQPVAFWGVGFYALMLALSFVGTLEKFEQDRRIATALLALTGWGVVFSTWLTYLELAVIHAICQWCVVSACLVVVLFGLSLAEHRASRASA